jgi:hypothetical protein
MSYDFEPLDKVVRGWAMDSMSEADRLEFEREYNAYLDSQAKDFDEEAYVKYMEQEEAAFIKSLVNSALI